MLSKPKNSFVVKYYIYLLIFLIYNQLQIVIVNFYSFKYILNQSISGYQRSLIDNPKDNLLSKEEEY